MQLILPKTLIPDKDILRPLFFLAGPIKGGGNWQEAACHFLCEQNDSIAVAAPRRWLNDNNHSLVRHFIEGQPDAFERQTLWERHYLERASKWGAIIFWLPCQSKDEPRTDGQPYARDSYGELGAWRTKLAADPTLRVVIGAEPDFPGLSVLSYNLNEDVGGVFPIYPTMEATLLAALAKAEA